MARRLVVQLDQFPPEQVHLQWPELGGWLTTRAEGHPEAEELDKPHVSIFRDLTILPDGTEQEGGNELTISGSTPIGDGLVSRVHLEFAFTQHSKLVEGDLSISAVLSALSGDQRNHLSPRALAATVSTQHTNRSVDVFVFYNSFSRTWLWLADSSLDEREATDEEIWQAVSTAEDVLQLIEVTLEGRLVPTDSTDPARGSDHVFPVYDGTMLQEIGACKVACESTGQIVFDHPSWGRSLLVTTLPVPQFQYSGGQIIVLDSGEAVRWKHDVGPAYVLELAEVHYDETGHVFLDYDPGRLNGVIVLRPIIDGFDAFGSLPAADYYRTPFYGAWVEDLDGDGVLEVVVDRGACGRFDSGLGLELLLEDSICTEEDVQTYRWNGENYVVE